MKFTILLFLFSIVLVKKHHHKKHKKKHHHKKVTPLPVPADIPAPVRTNLPKKPA